MCFVFSSLYFSWTSSSLDVPAGVTQEEGHTGFLIHLLSACCLYLCRFVGFRGVSATPTPQISWHKTPSARFRLLCHLLRTKSNKHMLGLATNALNVRNNKQQLQLMLLLMPKKPIYAVVRASIMGQGLAPIRHEEALEYLMVRTKLRIWASSRGRP